MSQCPFGGQCGCNSALISTMRMQAGLNELLAGSAVATVPPARTRRAERCLNALLAGSAVATKIFPHWHINRHVSMPFWRAVRLQRCRHHGVSSVPPCLNALLAGSAVATIRRSLTCGPWVSQCPFGGQCGCNSQDCSTVYTDVVSMPFWRAVRLQRISRRRWKTPSSLNALLAGSAVATAGNFSRRRGALKARTWGLEPASCGTLSCRFGSFPSAIDLARTAERAGHRLRFARTFRSYSLVKLKRPRHQFARRPGAFTASI